MASGILVMVLPLAVSCSVISGNTTYSDDPAVAAQQRRVEALEAELKEQKRMVEEAKEREEAAENRLEAAKHELKALEVDAKQRDNNY